MAEQPQLLLEFSQNLISDLGRGAVSPQEAIAACQQYAYLREALSSEALPLTGATLEGDEELTSALLKTLTETHERLSSLPSFHAQMPDEIKTEKEIRDAAFLRETALDRARGHTNQKLSLYKDQRRKFIQDLVKQYSKRPLSGSEGTVEKEIDRAFVATASEGARDTQQEFAQNLTEAVSEVSESPLTQKQQDDLMRDFTIVTAEHGEYIDAAVANLATEYALVRTLNTHMNLRRADVVTDIYLNAPDDRKEEALVRGVKLAGVAEALETYKNEPVSSAGFFTQENTKGVIKGLQRAADGILSVAGEPVRDVVYRNKVEGVFRSMLKNTQELTDRMGESFVRSALFAKFTKDLNTSLGEKRSSSGSSVAGDIFTTIFRGPLDPALTRATKDRIHDYYDLARANANAPDGYGFFAGTDIPIYHMFSPDMIRFGEHGLHRSSSGAVSLRARFPHLPFGLVGSAGNLASRAITSGIDNATSFVFTSPALPMEIRRSRRALSLPAPITRDMPLLVAIVVIATIVLLFIFPSPLNLTQTDSSSKTASLLASLIPRNEIEEPEIICTDCKWPTTGCISQGPNTPYDSHSSGTDKNAIDIAAAMGTDVVAIDEGDVVNTHDGCLNLFSPGCGYGYGNYADIRHNGKTYRYAHLMRGSVIAKGIQVSRGTRIGRVDNSGYSFGSHLHFELVFGQPGSINDVLPVTVPGCVGQYEWYPGPNCPKLMGGRDKSCVSIN